MRRQNFVARKMAITRSLRNKIFLLLIIMGAVPLIIVTLFSARNSMEEMEDNAKRNGLLRNSIVSQYVTQLCEKNFHVMHSLAINPILVEYFQNPYEENFHKMSNLIFDTNRIFHDKNLTALTGKDAQQIVRTDYAPLVNLSGRQHFHEAMRGRSFISDVLISRSTGERVIILEVPVKDNLNKPVGMVQRNFNLNVLQEFIQSYDSDENSVIIIDREGKTIAHSDEENYANFINEDKGEGRYKYLADKIQKSSFGNFRDRVDGKDCIINYSRNWRTNWIIITIQPYTQIWKQIYYKIFQSIILGAIIMAAIFALAFLISFRVTRPLVQITDAANKIIAGNGKIEKIEIHSDDEFGQMAAAFNKIRSARDAYQLEAELDTLTKLYNKATTENIGKMKLQTFNASANDTFLALYIIDLDHFKEANDTYGHQFGDKVLTEFAKNLRKKFRPNDCIGRFGGDEFVVIIDNLPDIEIAIRKAKDIKQVAPALLIDGINPGVTASIGIAIVPNDGTDYDTVFKAADNALYYVKAHGRNGFYYNGADGVG